MVETLSVNREFDKLKQEVELMKTMLGALKLHNEYLEAEVKNILVGSIVPFATTVPPYGWLECSGQTVSREKYSKLFEKIGITFGAGDGQTTFQLPDLKGQFVRGWDQTGQIDPNRPLGSFQSDQIQTHKHNDAGHSHSSDAHSHSFTTNSAGEHRHSGRAQRGDDRDGGSQGWLPPGHTNSNSYKTSDRGWDHQVNPDAMTIAGNHSHSGGTSEAKTSIHNNYADITEPTQAQHGAETRPKNIALLYCIKY